MRASVTGQMRSASSRRMLLLASRQLVASLGVNPLLIFVPLRVVTSETTLRVYSVAPLVSNIDTLGSRTDLVARSAAPSSGVSN